MTVLDATTDNLKEKLQAMNPVLKSYAGGIN